MEKTLCFIIDKKELFLDINIVTFDIPLLFTCFDDDNQKYLVLCCDSQELRYLVAKINNEILKEMLMSEITMKEAFKQSNKIWEIISQEEIDNDTINVIQFSSISDKDLPQNGAYLNYMNKDIANYVKQLNSNVLLTGLHIVKNLKMRSSLITNINITKRIINVESNENESMTIDFFKDFTMSSDYNSFIISNKCLEGDALYV